MSHPSSPTLTIAIPFYAGQPYLRLAINSVCRQDRSDWQLLICDDAGPEPGTEDLVRSYGDPRLSYHRNERNLGMSGNWNRCLDLAGTDLVTLLHADDLLLPNYTRLMTTAAEADADAAAFFCGARIIDADGNACFSLADAVKSRLHSIPARGRLRLEGRAGVEALLPGNFIMCPTVCYRKIALGSRRFRPDLRQVQDLELFTRLLLDGKRLVGLPQVAYAYRRHPANATARQTRELVRFEEESALFDYLACRAEERGWWRAARLARDKRIIKLHLAFQMLRDLGGLRLADLGSKLRFLWRLGLPCI